MGFNTYENKKEVTTTSFSLFTLSLLSVFVLIKLKNIAVLHYNKTVIMCMKKHTALIEEAVS